MNNNCNHINRDCSELEEQRRIIGKKFLDAFKNGEHKIILADKNFVNSVNKKYLSQVIINLCQEKKYDIAILLSKATNYVTLNMFPIKCVYHMIEHEDSELLKAFVKRFREIFRRTNYKNVSSLLCKFHGLEIVKFIL